MSDASYVPSVAAIGYGVDTPTDTTGKSAGTRRIKEDVALECIPNDPNPSESGLDCFADTTSNAQMYMTASEFMSGDSTCEGDSGSGAYEQSNFDAGRWVSFGILSRGGTSSDGTTCIQPIYSRFDAWGSLLISAAKTAATAGGYALPGWAGGATSSADAGSTPAGSSSGGATAGGSSGGGTTAGTGAAAARAATPMRPRAPARPPPAATPTGRPASSIATASPMPACRRRRIPASCARAPAAPATRAPATSRARRPTAFPRSRRRRAPAVAAWRRLPGQPPCLGRRLLRGGSGLRALGAPAGPGGRRRGTGHLSATGHPNAPATPESS